MPSVLGPPILRSTLPSTPSGIGAFEAEMQVNRIVDPLLQQRDDAVRQALINRNLASLNSVPMGKLPTGQSGITGTAGPYYGIQLTRDPEIEAAVGDVLNRIRSTDLNKITRDTRSPMLGGLTAAAGAQLGTDITAGRQSLAELAKQFTETTPEVMGFTRQEVGRLGEVYGGVEQPGSMSANLADIRRQASQSLANRLRTNLGQVTRAGKMGGLTGNTNLVTDRILAQETARILAEQALQDAGLARADELAVRQAQAGLSGQRARLLNEALTRQLVPTQMQGQLRADELASLAQLAGVELPNQILQRGAEPLGAEVDLLTRLLGPREFGTYRGLGSVEGPDLRGLDIGPAPDLGGLNLDPDMLLQLLNSNQPTTRTASTGGNDELLNRILGLLEGQTAGLDTGLTGEPDWGNTWDLPQGWEDQYANYV